MPSCRFALCFQSAAASQDDFDDFLRVSSPHTMSAVVRESSLSGGRFDEATRRAAAAALDSFFQDNITLELPALEAMLPHRARDGGMGHSLLCDIFRSIADTSNLQKSSASGGVGGGTQQHQTLSVHVGGVNYFSAGDYADLQTRSTAAGVPPRSVMRMPTFQRCSRLLSHSQWVGGLAHILLAVRAALGRHGSASSDPWIQGTYG